MMADGKTCLLDELQNANCVSMSITEMVTFHTNALTRFINGALIPNLVLLVVLFVIVLAVAVAEAVPRYPLGMATIPNDGPPPVVSQLTEWISRFTISPPSLIFGRA